MLRDFKILFSAEQKTKDEAKPSFPSNLFFSTKPVPFGQPELHTVRIPRGRHGIALHASFFSRLTHFPNENASHDPSHANSLLVLYSNALTRHTQPSQAASPTVCRRHKERKFSAAASPCKLGVLGPPSDAISASLCRRYSLSRPWPVEAHRRVNAMVKSSSALSSQP
ncbi:uncharacterized protein Triagg1_7279 [Trichoderma aggressivum f. europaeum]|uniref:Uncharacterized protein n=1 Tax=Trichoderma aggressivum f. europaeum TaxID=173218 RepID=A0AAE1J2U0_9HYPO|nr:hypothetical protein Triagg1_7279 [Trichoderma aggressivum f. europaeum]